MKADANDFAAGDDARARSHPPRQPPPERPDTLPPWAETTLAALSTEPVAENVILGGGIALKHYDDFRATQDIDAWWRHRPTGEDLTQLADAMRRVAETQGYAISHRRWSQTDSYEFRRPDSRKKQFSFQISVRDVTLDPPVPSSWPPVRLETLRDNIGSKMNALVERGAARDFLDIYRVVHDGLMTPEECWALYLTKNPGRTVEEASESVLSHLVQLEGRRPLDTITDPTERQAAETLRTWYHTAFLRV